MASKRQIWVADVPVGGGAPVVVQSMTKTDTSDVEATLEQIGRMVDAGCELVRVAVPRDKDAVALETIVKRSPVPVIADIHFNHTLALKAIDAGAHCIRLNPGNIGGREKVAEVAQRATAAGVPMRIGVNSGSLPKHLHELERDDPVEALVTAAVEFVDTDGEPRLRELQGVGQVHERAEHDRRQPPAVASGSTTRCTSASPRAARAGRARSSRRSGSARCWPRASATRSASRSRPSTPRRR